MSQVSNPSDANGPQLRVVHEEAVAHRPTGAKSTAGWQWRLAKVLLCGLVIAPFAGAAAFFARYDTSQVMLVPIQEFKTFEYPEDPSGRGPKYAEYNGRQLTLIQRDATHFDFVFEPTEKHVAKVVFKNVDVSLMTPGLPSYAKQDPGLQRIALTDREWNRQQVQFDVDTDDIEVTGGDGFERENLKVASLAKNCLNAGLWEVLLSTKTDAGKQMYYQGWFTFPMGQYKRLWEQNTGLSYWDDFNWYRMEHWLDPAGNEIPMDKLRRVAAEQEVLVKFDPNEPIAFSGEQIRKRRTTLATNVVTWDDVCRKQETIRFATFIPPGTYSVDHPWANEYWRLASLNRAVHRRVTSELNGEPLDELELSFTSADGKQECQFIVGGVDLAKLPTLKEGNYPKGLYMPMGIGVPPFYQDYQGLKAAPPMESPYYSFLLDDEDRWIDHHSAAVDGPVMHRDADNPDLIHLYFLSYERHLLVAHFEITLPETSTATAMHAAASASKISKRLFNN